MFCKHCGAELENGASFCDVCGQQFVMTDNMKREQSVLQTQQPQQQPAAEAAALPAKRSHKKLKIILIILAALLLIGGIVFGAIYYYILHKPGNTVLLACAKTFNSESFLAESDTVIYVDEAVAVYSDTLSNSGNIAEVFIKKQLVETVKNEIKEKLGITSDKVTFNGSFGVVGKGDDCVIYSQIEDAIQFRLDSDTARLLVGNEYTREHDMEDIERNFDDNKYVRNFFNIIAVRGQDDDSDGESKAAKQIKEFFSENYDQLGYVLADLLNDTGAGYMKSYEKDGDTYTFNIDAYAFIRALADNEKLDCKQEFKDAVEKYIKKLEKKNIKSIECLIKATVGKGRIDHFEQSLTINGHTVATTTTTYSDYDDVDSSELDIKQFKGVESSSQIIVKVMSFLQGRQLSSMNTDAEVVFTKAKVAAEDILDEGGSVSDIYAPSAPVSIEELGESDGKVEQAIYTALDDMGEDNILIYWEIDEDGMPTFAQVCRKDSGIVGQEPDPESNSKQKHEIGTKFTPSADEDE